MRLCMMMAWEYFKTLNKHLAKKSEKLTWEQRDRITLTFTVSGKEKNVRFSVNDFAKLYVMDRPDFLIKLFEYFFDDKTKDVDYHKLYSEGLDKYSDFQRECMTAILEFEEKIVTKKGMVLNGNTHFKFYEIAKEELKDTNEIDAVNKVRKSVFHYKLDFEKEDIRRFYKVMKNEKIRREWPLKV